MKSGVQKYIRRGETVKALFCAGEMDLFKEAPARGETIRTNFLHRLLIIYLEDVENLSMLEFVHKNITALFKERDKMDGDGTDRDFYIEEEWIAELIIAMCASKKARVASHVRAMQKTDFAFEQAYPSIPWGEMQDGDLAFYCKMFKKYYKEKHILAAYYGNKIHHSEEKLPTKIYKSSKPVWFIFKELYNPMTAKMIDIFMGWYKNYIGDMKEGFLCWLIPLLHLIGVIPMGAFPEVDKSLDKSWDKNRDGDVIEVDDYVADRHTKKGRGKSVTEFATVGAHVENEAEFVNPLWKRLYEDRKRWEDGVPILGENNTHFRPVMMETVQSSVKILKPKAVSPLPKAVATFPIPMATSPVPKAYANHFQTVVPKPMVIPKPDLVQSFKSLSLESDSKNSEDSQESESESESEMSDSESLDWDSDPLESEYTFVVRTQLTTSNAKTDVYFAMDGDKSIVIKGPFSDREEINALESITKWKQAHGFPYIPFTVKQMIPDRWPEGVPLGIRNRIDRSVPAFFVIFDSMIQTFTTKMHSSKVWPQTEVVQWDKVKFHYDYETATEQEQRDYVYALLFRYVLGVPDLADRNFLVVNGRTISIDEELQGREVKFMAELKKTKAKIIHDWLDEHYEELNLDWKVISPNKITRLQHIKTKEGCLALFKA
jgi:hypothetical protein